MNSYAVRDLVMWSDEEIARLPKRHVLVFDNGETVVSGRCKTIYSHLFWPIFRVYTATRILPKHCVAHILNGDYLDSDTNRKLLTNILRSVIEDERLYTDIEKEPLLALIQRTNAHASNVLSVISEKNMINVDVLDFVQISHHPEVLALKEEAYKDARKIKYAYEQTMEIIRTDAGLRHNGLAKAVRARMVKENQVAQCVVFRGIPTEVDGARFPVPIWSNYTEGNRTLYAFAADSRTAAKSHFYSDSSLEDSEYMARKFQLFSQVVEAIVHGDCGSTKYKAWLVKPATKDDAGTVTYPGDLKFLVGKYYLDEDSGGLRAIEGNEKHLIGKIIKLRTINHCLNHQKKGKIGHKHVVCSTCAGKLSENISRFANIGHLGSVSTTKDLTQSILSIKHVNTSAIDVKVLLKEYELKFMNTGTYGTAFHLNPSVVAMAPKLVVAREELPGLIDLQSTTDLDSITPSRVSKTTQVKLLTTANGRDVEVVLDVTQKLKPSMLSVSFLEHAIKHGWTTDAQNNFVFDLTEWDPSLPVFVMPNKEYSFVDLAAAVDTLVRSNLKMRQKRSMHGAADTLLEELFDLVNSKMNTNILSFEIIVYALMVESPTSYAMARGAKEPVLGLAEPLTKFRSLGQAMAYQTQSATLTNPANFFKGTRPDSPMDVFLTPKQVVAYYK